MGGHGRIKHRSEFCAGLTRDKNRVQRSNRQDVFSGCCPTRSLSFSSRGRIENFRIGNSIETFEENFDLQTQKGNAEGKFGVQGCSKANWGIRGTYFIKFAGMQRRADNTPLWTFRRLETNSQAAKRSHQGGHRSKSPSLKVLHGKYEESRTRSFASWPTGSAIIRSKYTVYIGQVSANWSNYNKFRLLIENTFHSPPFISTQLTRR